MPEPSGLPNTLGVGDSWEQPLYSTLEPCPMCGGGGCQGQAHSFRRGGSPLGANGTHVIPRDQGLIIVK